MVFCLGWAVTRAYPRRRVRGEFPHPGMTIVIEKGDLFDVRGNIVVGFTDTFDTAVDCPVHAASVQGQLLNRLYGADPAKLDRELAFALRDTPPQSWERRANKPVGNLARYPLGTVAVLRQGSRRVFAVAYSRLGNNGVAQSGVEELWFSLNRLWDAVHRHGPQETITLPLVGTGLARLDGLDANGVLRLVILSFVGRSRERRVCRQLRIIIRPSDLPRIDLAGTTAFLRSLGATAGRAGRG
ncbi:hypothetical protein GCM10029964_068000 [Kibdelosporangium lantanae]